MALELVNQLPYDHPYRWDGTLFGKPKLWRPDELGADLALWLDAEDTASITLNGSTVSQWNDKSGNGYAAAQGTASAQPAYSATGLNGKPALVFDGTSDFMSIPNGPNVSAQHVLVGVVRQISGVPTRYIGKWAAGRTCWLLSPSEASPSSTARWITSTSANVFSIAAVSGNILTTPLIHGGQLIGGTQSAFINGTVGGTAVTGVGTPNVNTDPVVLGIIATGVTDFTNYAAAEYVLLDGAQATVENRQKLEGYLAWKWGLAANLPAAHPYKLNPPTV